MELRETADGFALFKEKTQIGECRLRVRGCGAEIEALCIAEAWRRRGFGTYFLKEILRRYGGFARNGASFFTAPLPADAGERAFYEKAGFREEDGRLVRRRTPDLTAVQLSHDFLRQHLHEPRFCIDATCGNGGDTLFLAGLTAPSGRVLALDIQPEAAESTRCRLKEAGAAQDRVTVLCADHARLRSLAAPESADAVLFNFGWLPGADHSRYSTEETSLPALEAALDVLRPGGILSAVLYSGRVIGSGEKEAVLRWLEALPLSKYTVLICRFGNWADTAPLPCFVIKKA